MHNDITAAELATLDAIASDLTDGEATLDDAMALLERFCVLPSRAAYIVATLWAAHTHALDAHDRLAFYTSPRLAYLSNLPGSGKTTAAEMTCELSSNGMMLVDPTAASFVHAVQSRRTPFLDETDILFGERTGGGKPDLRAILNTGYKRGAEWSRGTQPPISVFAPVCFAGLDRAFRREGSSLSTLRSRTICILMERSRAPEPFRPRRHDAIMAACRTKLRAWVKRNTAQIAKLYPDTDALDLWGRDAEIAEPLLAVAEIAGGHWVNDAKDAVRELLQGASNADPELATSVELLRDVRAVLGSAPAMASIDVVDALCSLPGSDWHTQWPVAADAPSELARLLRRFDVRPGRIRVDGRQARGYRASDLGVTGVTPESEVNE